MNKDEIIRYCVCSAGVTIDRCLMLEYPCMVRNIQINDCNIIFIDYEGYKAYEGTRITLYYNDLDEIVNELEIFLNKKIDQWINFNKTGEYPTLIINNYKLYDSISENTSKKFNYDLKNKRLELPKGYKKLNIN